MGSETNIIETWKNLCSLTINICEGMDNELQEQLLRLDVIYNNALQNAQKQIAVNLSNKNTNKNELKEKNGQNKDLFSVVPSFHPPSVSFNCKTKEQASFVVMDKIVKNVCESATVSSGAFTRGCKARELSTFISSTSLDCPKANSTLIVRKKLLESIKECISPQKLFPKIRTCYNATNLNQAYNKSIESLAIDENSNFAPSTKKKSVESQKKNKMHEKLEDIDVNIGEQFQYRTRNMKKKLEEENQIISKKTNVIHVPLEKLISTPLKPSDDVLQTPHQIREIEAKKRKELYLKFRADQRKIDDLHLKAANKRLEQMNLLKEKLKQSSENKRKQEEKQKANEILIKKVLLKKKKQTELRLIEINAKRKQGDEAKRQKWQNTPMNHIIIENELNSESKTPCSKVGTPKLPLSSVKNIPAFPKLKIKNNEIHIHDYGLNDVSVCDSSDDELNPKKSVPIWAKRENRKTILELQYHLNIEERNLYFNCPKSINFKGMFKGWNIRDKQRTSSAVWNIPP